MGWGERFRPAGVLAAAPVDARPTAAEVTALFVELCEPYDRRARVRATGEASPR